jgi:hypothetical protein
MGLLSGDPPLISILLYSLTHVDSFIIIITSYCMSYVNYAASEPRYTGRSSRPSEGIVQRILQKFHGRGVSEV